MAEIKVLRPAETRIGAIGIVPMGDNAARIGQQLATSGRRLREAAFQVAYENEKKEGQEAATLAAISAKDANGKITFPEMPKDLSPTAQKYYEPIARKRFLEAVSLEIDAVAQQTAADHERDPVGFEDTFDKYLQDTINNSGQFSSLVSSIGAVTSKQYATKLYTDKVDHSRKIAASNAVTTIEAEQSIITELAKQQGGAGAAEQKRKDVIQLAQDAVAEYTELGVAYLSNVTSEANFNYAKGRSYFSGDNPAADFKDNFNDEIQDHTDYYSTEAMNKIIAAGLKLSKNGEKRVAALGVVAALLCGGRPPSEVFNLTTDMIDLKNKVIHYKKTKTKQWSRPITPRMVQHLQYIWDLRSNGDEYMYYSKDDLRHKYLFPNIRYGQMRRGKKGLRPCKLLHINEVRKVWKEIKAMASVEDRDLKSLRHTFAVFCVTQNIGLRVIQKYLGHKKIETTMIYAAATDSYVNSESEKTTAGYAA